MAEPPGHARRLARGGPGLPKVAARLPRPLALTPGREERGDDAPEPAPEGLDAIELARQEALSSGVR